MILLDTDTVSLLYAGHADVIRRFDRADKAIVRTSVITEIEILRGRYEFLMKAADSRQLQRAQSLLDQSRVIFHELKVVPVTAAAADEFERLREIKSLRKRGRADLLIASIALANSATLVTHNRRHFELVPELQIDDWAA